jgi:hypothetical protein
MNSSCQGVELPREEREALAKEESEIFKEQASVQGKGGHARAQRAPLRARPTMHKPTPLHASYDHPCHLSTSPRATPSRAPSRFPRRPARAPRAPSPHCAPRRACPAPRP